jgi:hypothetical protein
MVKWRLVAHVVVLVLAEHGGGVPLVVVSDRVRSTIQPRSVVNT